MKIKSIFKKYRYNENNININELKEIMEKQENVLLLDVRSVQEFNEGHLNRSNKYTIIWIKDVFKI